MRTIQDLRENRSAVAKQMRKLLDDYPGEKWGEEQKKAWDAFQVQIDALDGEISRTEKVLADEADAVKPVLDRAERKNISTDEANAELTGEKRIFLDWLRYGENGLNAEQRQHIQARREAVRTSFSNMSTVVPSEGGYLVPDSFGGRLIEALKAYGGMREVAQIIQTAAGNDILWPTTDATAEEGEIIGENGTVTDDETTSFGMVKIGSHMYSSKAVPVPFQLIMDSGIDIEGHIVNRLRDRIGRVTNKHFTVGTGVAQPKGVVLCAGSGKVGATGQADSVTWQDLNYLTHSVDPAYRASGSCRFMFNDTTLRIIKDLADGFGRPIFLPGITAGEPDRIMNYPYVINQDVASMAANAKSILFGDFSYYVIRDIMQFMLFRMTDSAYTKKAQVGFLAFSRHDGNFIGANDGPIKYYQNSAS